MSARRRPLPIRAINHFSHVCSDVSKTAEWYKSLLGFGMIQRPQSFKFEGAWLFGYGIGLHLIGGQPPHANRDVIDPKADHISFACDCGLEDVEALLIERKVKYVKAHVQEGGILVTQLFMHDPDGNMVELCNCDLLPVQRLASMRLPSLTLPSCPSCFLPAPSCLTQLDPCPDSDGSSDTDMGHGPQLQPSDCDPHPPEAEQQLGPSDPPTPPQAAARAAAKAAANWLLLSGSTPHTLGMRRVCSVPAPHCQCGDPNPLPGQQLDSALRQVADQVRAGQPSWAEVPPHLSMRHSPLHATTSLKRVERVQAQRSHTIHTVLEAGGSGSGSSSGNSSSWQVAMDVLDSSRPVDSR